MVVVKDSSNITYTPKNHAWNDALVREMLSSFPITATITVSNLSLVPSINPGNFFLSDGDSGGGSFGSSVSTFNVGMFQFIVSIPVFPSWSPIITYE